MYIFNHT
jgi:hypothetical protein